MLFDEKIFLNFHGASRAMIILKEQGGDHKLTKANNRIEKSEGILKECYLQDLCCPNCLNVVGFTCRTCSTPSEHLLNRSIINTEKINIFTDSVRQLEFF